MEVGWIEGGGALTLVTALVGGIAKLSRDRRLIAKDKTSHSARVVFLEQEIEKRDMLLRQQGRADEVDAIIDVDVASGKVLRWNLGAALLLGHREHDAVGKHFSILIPRDLRAKTLKIWEKFGSAGRYPNNGPYDVFALHRSGDKVPVTLLLTACERGMTKLVTATLQKRVPSPVNGDYHTEEGDSQNVPHLDS